MEARTGDRALEQGQDGGHQRAGRCRLEGQGQPEEQGQVADDGQEEAWRWSLPSAASPRLKLGRSGLCPWDASRGPGKTAATAEARGRCAKITLQSAKARCLACGPC